MNFIDKVVSFFDPQAGLRRLTARTASEVMQRRYEAAGTGRRTKNWTTTNLGPNSVNEVSLDRLRGRARDMVRNNGWAKNAVTVIAANVVGTGIQPNVSNKRVRSLWQQWAETKDCDFFGHQNVYGLQRQIMEAVARDGECIIRKRRIMTKSGIPLKLQVQEADVIDTARSFVAGGNEVIQGKEYDQNGMLVAYWLYDHHPNDANRFSTPRRIPASEVIHIYRSERPGQVRGVPWLAPVMLRLKDYDDYEDAELLRQKISACFTAFVQDANPQDAIASEDGTLIERVEPGIIEHLPPGKTITFGNPPTTQNYDSYGRRILMGVARGLGISYEALTGDLSNVNFSSARMGWIEMQRNVEDWQYNMLVPQLCDSVWDWFVQAGLLAGRVPTSQVGAIQWTPPRREMIDPTREIPALINGVRGGIISLQEVHRQSGYDSETVLRQMAEDNKLIDELGLILDSDARKTMKAGVTQAYFKRPSDAAEFTDSPEEAAAGSQQAGTE